MLVIGYVFAIRSERLIRLLPSGRARPETIPTLTGSPMGPMTIGIVPVACLAAIAAGVPQGHDDVDRHRGKRQPAVAADLRPIRRPPERVDLSSLGHGCSVAGESNDADASFVGSAIGRVLTAVGNLSARPRTCCTRPRNAPRRSTAATAARSVRRRAVAGRRIG
jgi:hypothetical protein